MNTNNFLDKILFIVAGINLAFAILSLNHLAITGWFVAFIYIIFNLQSQ